MATKPGSRQLSWLPNNLFDTGGMPAWLATAFDTDERRAEFTRWMGDMFAQWTYGQSVNADANAAAVTANRRRFVAQPATGRYFSQRQLEEVFHPEDRATRVERLRFHGGMANGRWTNDYDTWKAASKNGHGTDSKGEEIKTRSFGFRVPTAREREMSADRGFFDDPRFPNKVEAMSKAAGGDYRGVRLNDDGSLTWTFGRDDVTRRLTAQRRAEWIENTNGEWMFDDNGRLKAKYAAVDGGRSARPVLGDSPYQMPPRSAEKGGEAMRERGWLDAVFNGGLTRAALRGGRAGK